jgi:hypothetical protein
MWKDHADCTLCRVQGRRPARAFEANDCRRIAFPNPTGAGRSERDDHALDDRAVTM